MSVNVMGIFVRGQELQLHSKHGRVKSMLSLRCVKLQAEEGCYFRRLRHRQTDLPYPVNERDRDPDEGIIAFSKCHRIGIVRVDEVHMEWRMRYMLGNILPLIPQGLIQIRLNCP